MLTEKIENRWIIQTTAWKTSKNNLCLETWSKWHISNEIFNLPSSPFSNSFATAWKLLKKWADERFAFKLLTGEEWEIFLSQINLFTSPSSWTRGQPRRDQEGRLKLGREAMGRAVWRAEIIKNRRRSWKYLGKENCWKKNKTWKQILEKWAYF